MRDLDSPDAKVAAEAKSNLQKDAQSIRADIIPDNNMAGFSGRNPVAMHNAGLIQGVEDSMRKNGFPNMKIMPNGDFEVTTKGKDIDVTPNSVTTKPHVPVETLPIRPRK